MNIGIIQTEFIVDLMMSIHMKQANECAMCSECVRVCVLHCLCDTENVVPSFYSCLKSNIISYYHLEKILSFFALYLRVSECVLARVGLVL